MSKLKWIEEKPPERPVIDDDDFPLVGRQRSILRKLEENMLVPLGLAATVACLTMGLVNLQRGDSKKQQFYMRGRVGFQMFTIAAMVFGMFLQQRRRERNKDRRPSE